MLQHAATYIGLSSWLYAIPHEATHYAVARLATDDAYFKVEVACDTGFAHWEDINSPAMRFFANLAPTIFGSLLAAVWLVSGIRVDGWRLIFAMGLAFYTLPSPRDIRSAIGRQPEEKEI